MAADRATDVIIVGGGVMGCAAAWRLARDGHRVRLLEQFAIGHGDGSSHGPSRMIRLAYDAPDYVQLGQAAFVLWDELQGESLLLRTGGINVGLPHANEMAGIARTYDALGVPYEQLDRDELHRRFPQLNLPDGTIGLFQEDYGILAATRCVTALAARARVAGAALHDEEPALEITPDGDGVTVRTARADWRADRVILTAGSWTQPLLSPLGINLPLTVLQEQLAFFRVREPEAHGPDRLPLVMHRFPGTTSIGSIFPISGHAGVKVMLDRIGPAVDPANPGRAIDPVLLERLRAYATDLLPGVTGEILETTSCRYTMTPDEDFIIDRHPEYPQVVIASTCSGHGFKFAPVIGQMLADLAVAGETPYPTARFRLDRPALSESWSRGVEKYALSPTPLPSSRERGFSSSLLSPLAPLSAASPPSSSTTLEPIDTLHLFPGERAALLDLLGGLSSEEWAAPTVCPGWSVKDVALHLLGDDVGRLSWGRDEFVNPSFAAGIDIGTLPGLVAAIDRQNAVWVEGTRRISPRLLIELLRLTGELTADYFQRLDLTSLGMPVDWAGPDPAPVWFDIAREYTERWVHQQHIRDAVGQPGLKERRWFAPVLEAFVRGLPRVLRDAPAPDGTALRLTITGDAGGEWVARRENGDWILGTAPGAEVAAVVELDQETAWRLFTKGISREEARQATQIDGDATLADRALDTVSILA